MRVINALIIFIIWEQRFFLPFGGLNVVNGWQFNFFSQTWITIFNFIGVVYYAFGCFISKRKNILFMVIINYFMIVKTLFKGFIKLYHTVDDSILRLSY